MEEIKNSQNEAQQQSAAEPVSEPQQQPNAEPQPKPKFRFDPVQMIINVGRRMRAFMRGRFSLREDSATQQTVMGEIWKSIEFKGTNLWVLIFAVFIASLGLNTNSTAVIIGAMLVSPLMGPIIGIGASLGVNDFELLKQSWRNFLLMIIVSLITSTLFFIISPISTAQSELLARTMPTTYDVLIAFFGGLAGMVAQTRRDKSITVISGVAIATALMPPLCTAGFGLATLNFSYFIGALYLFTINTVFIALAAYVVVRFLRYDKATVLDAATQKKSNRYMTIIVIVVVVPSIILASNIISRTTFEENVDRYVSKVFQYEKTMVVDYTKEFHYEGRKSRIELRLVGEGLSKNELDNARAQMPDYGLQRTELVIRQAEGDEKVDISSLQRGYADIIDEKNRQIDELRTRLASLTTADTLSGADISREVVHVADNVAAISISKHTPYYSGVADQSYVVAVVKPKIALVDVDIRRIEEWLKDRTKSRNVMVVVEQ